ncbi:hypothetical protein DFH09DRAFT_1138122 [Mycena vulgaris]|nr:hypothetical protein DFH09DRAFT_1138122 [Mycena vulgaris]
MSPILSLPNELLAEIVAVGQAEERLELERVLTLSHRFHSVGSNLEWTLSHVSRRFREAIIGAPVLWTIVRIDFTFEGSVAISKLYLERSQRCKIWVNTHDTAVPRDSSLDHLMANQFSHIIPHTPRIWRLSLDSGVHSLVATLLAFRDVAVPALEHLEIETGGMYANCPLEMFSAGPPIALTRLKIDGSVPTSLPQWTASLTHLDLWRGEGLGSDRTSFFMAIPTRCPSLVHLCFDTTSFDSPPNLARMSILSLRSLRIILHRDYDTPHLVGVIGLFDTPAVTDLTIDYVHGDQICVLFDPTSLPDLSFPALTSLSFVNLGCGCEVDDLASDLQVIPSPPARLFPTLSSLALVNVCFVSYIVEQILGPASQPWPRLGTVTICPNKTAVHDVGSPLRGAIDSRRQRGQAIPKLRLSAPMFYQKYWDENGVDVELFDPSELIRGLTLN